MAAFATKEKAKREKNRGDFFTISTPTAATLFCPVIYFVRETARGMSLLRNYCANCCSWTNRVREMCRAKGFTQIVRQNVGCGVCNERNISLIESTEQVDSSDVTIDNSV